MLQNIIEMFAELKFCDNIHEQPPKNYLLRILSNYDKI